MHAVDVRTYRESISSTPRRRPFLPERFQDILAIERAEWTTDGPVPSRDPMDELSKRTETAASAKPSKKQNVG